MATRTLNRPNGWKKQVNPNTQRMKALMRDVRGNTVRLTRNSKDLDEWMEKLAPYTASNCFTTGPHAEEVRDIVNQIAGVVDQTSLPSGANAEIIKGVMAEKCMTMVSNVGEDIKTELRKIAVESYNARNNPQQTAKLIGEKIDSLSKTRCQAIARTETCRAANLGNYLNAKEMGARSYRVLCNEGACEYCVEAYDDTVFDIEDTDALPPFHPNCRCTPVWSTEPAPGSEDMTAPGEEQNEETPKQMPTPIELPPENPRIAELEKEIEDVQAIADKWRSRGNMNMARTFEERVKNLKAELEELQNPSQPTTTQQEADNNLDVINNALREALKDVGLEEIAPEHKSINPNVKIEKNIETTHESNLWENLASKHGFELVEASNTKVTFYDPKFETPIRCNIAKNNDWIDYTNSGNKKLNIEEVLKSYNDASDIQKQATPIIILQGKSLEHGCVTISQDEFKLELFEGAFYKMKDSINGGDIKGVMHHEMWHCVDIRLIPEDEARTLRLLYSNKKGSPYKKDVTKDRRSRKKTGGDQFVSEYARQSGSGNKVFEDFAESGGIMTSDTFLIVPVKGGYAKMSKSEFIRKYPNRARHIQDIIDNGKLLW